MPEVKIKLDICAIMPWFCPAPGGGPPGPAPVPGFPSPFNAMISVTQSDIQELERLSQLIEQGQDSLGQHRLQAARLILDNNRADIAKIIVDGVIVDLASAASESAVPQSTVSDAFNLRSEIQSDFVDPVQAYIDSYVARVLSATNGQ